MREQPNVVVGIVSVAELGDEIVSMLDTFLEKDVEIHMVHMDHPWGLKPRPHAAEVMTFLGRDEEDGVGAIMIQQYDMGENGWEFEKTCLDYSSVAEWLEEWDEFGENDEFNLSKVMIAIVDLPVEVVPWTIDRIMKDRPKIQVTLGGMITFDADILFGDEKYATIDSVAFSGSADWDTVIKCLNDNQPLHG